MARPNWRHRLRAANGSTNLRRPGPHSGGHRSPDPDAGGWYGLSYLGVPASTFHFQRWPAALAAGAALPPAGAALRREGCRYNKTLTNGGFVNFAELARDARGANRGDPSCFMAGLLVLRRTHKSNHSQMSVCARFSHEP
eukprot:4510861-Prymnesium_polylepis.4